MIYEHSFRIRESDTRDCGKFDSARVEIATRVLQRKVPIEIAVFGARRADMKPSAEKGNRW